jgi:hypothetical protein
MVRAGSLHGEAAFAVWCDGPFAGLLRAINAIRSRPFQEEAGLRYRSSQISSKREPLRMLLTIGVMS